jgi:hypothetical protein
MTGSPFGPPFGSGRADDGDPCGACDGTGHVCADEGTAVLVAGHHGGRLHPWDGLSDRSDACDHGGGAPCPVCMIAPGQERERPPSVVDAPLETRSPSAARLDLDPKQLGGGGRPLDYAYTRPDLTPLTPPPTGLDRVRDVVRRDRGQVTGAELAVGLAAMRARLIESRHLPPNTAILVPPGGGGLISDPDDRPWWRRQLGRLVCAVRGAFRR